ncbi:MAG: (2Fe-2S) ferredoxin domain-containing protein [Candidatus Aminicenantes bacterium]|nr:(2Fe-2S) ferredoxin domain-containing protein [Candidatus Aminicenantes bacterium]
MVQKKSSAKNKKKVVKKAPVKAKPIPVNALKKPSSKKAATRKTAAAPAPGKKLTIQDLAKVRDATRALLTIREGQGRAKVTIHMGTCGIAAGAREVMDALLDEMQKRKIKDVIVTTSGCAGLCSREPMATIEIAGNPPVKYVDLNSQKIRKILVDHVLDERVVMEYALAVGCETLY